MITDNPNGLADIRTYVASLSQSGSAAPVVEEMQNNTGKTVTWTRVGAGQYQAAFSDAILAGETTTVVTGQTLGFVKGYRQDLQHVRVDTFTYAGAAFDNLLQETVVEIKIYNTNFKP